MIDSNECVVIQRRGTLAELMCNVDPGLYSKFFSNNSKGELVLCVKIHQVLYGLLRSALFFYHRLVT